MSLADYYGGGYISSGEHAVTVTACKKITYNSGNAGVEWTLRDGRGRTTTVAVPLLEKCYWKIAKFAEACGITEEQARAYDPLDMRHHSRLINRSLVVRVEKPDKYAEVTDFWSSESDRAFTPGTPNPLAAPQIQEPEPIREEDIPF